MAAVSLILVPLLAMQGGQSPLDLDALLPGTEPAQRRAAFEAVLAAPDPLYRAPLVDLLRFADTRPEWFTVLDALGAVYAEDLRTLERPWYRLTLRLAADDRLTLPDGYAAWKGELLARRVDPRFRRFLFDGVPSRVRLDEVVWGGVAVDEIPALSLPASIPAGDATYLDGAEAVFGVRLGGEARAYPLRIVDWHEMVNDVVGGVPVALTYCTLCAAGILYRREVDGELFDFGSSGLLMRSNKLMFDRGTHTLWNQMTGEPVVGALAGEAGLALEPLPVVLTSWDAWRGQNPGTLVLDASTGFERDYRPGAAYGDYFASDRNMFPVTVAGGETTDRRRVLVVRTVPGANAAARAFELAGLASVRAHNVQVGGQGVLLLNEDPRPDVPLPASWGEASGSFRDLDWEALTALVEGRPERLAALDRAALAALTPAALRALLATGWLSPAQRREAGVLGLIGEVRAYERGQHVFRSGAGGELVDGSGRPWRVTEDALLGPDDARLLRLPAHLSFAFGWQAFSDASRDE